MKPIKFEGHNVVYAENQKEYNPLPAHRDENGVVTTCWQLDAEDLAEINRTGKIWLSQMTFNKPLQPVNMYADVKILNLKDFEDGKH